MSSRNQCGTAKFLTRLQNSLIQISVLKLMLFMWRLQAMRKFIGNPDSPTPSDLKKKFGDEADRYAQVRSEALAEAGNDEAPDRWEQLASELREDGTHGAET